LSGGAGAPAPPPAAATRHLGLRRDPPPTP
jgi:hypothetical protein